MEAGKDRIDHFRPSQVEPGIADGVVLQLQQRRQLVRGKLADALEEDLECLSSPTDPADIEALEVPDYEEEVIEELHLFRTQREQDEEEAEHERIMEK